VKRLTQNGQEGGEADKWRRRKSVGSNSVPLCSSSKWIALSAKRHWSAPRVWAYQPSAGLENFSCDVNDASIYHPEGARGRCRQVQDAMPAERAAIVYPNDDAASVFGISYANAGPKRQSPMSCCQSAAASRVIRAKSREAMRI
jgi:hypothetical protein